MPLISRSLAPAASLRAVQRAEAGGRRAADPAVPDATGADTLLGPVPRDHGPPPVHGGALGARPGALSDALGT